MAGVPARDRFELVSHLATGGMAELFLARRRDADPGEPCVVLKRILPDHARNPGFVAMFLDEARLAARLVHPNIAALLDVGRTGTTYFYTLEYVHGQNLRDVLQTAARTGLAIPPGVAVAIVCGAAAGLHAAHEQRGRDGRPLEIVHRDVSPSNVMVAYDGTIKVVDFGVAKAADRMTETRSGTVKGKIAYLSPEQALLRDLDRTSDVFSLGIVAWELATQRRLFKRPSDYETMRAIIDEPIPLASDVAAVPAALADVIAGALERRLDRRYPSAAAFAAALAAVADRAGWARDAAAVAATMRALFGAPPLPWLEPEREVTDTGVIPLTAIDVIELLDDDDAAAPAPVPAVTARIVAPRPSAAASAAAAASTAAAASAAAAAAVTAPVVRSAPEELAVPGFATSAAVATPAPVALPAPVASPAPVAMPAAVVMPAAAAVVMPPPRADRDGTVSVSTAWSLPTEAAAPARRGRGLPIALVASALVAAAVAAMVIGAGGGAASPEPPSAVAEPVAVVEVDAAVAAVVDAGAPPGAATATTAIVAAPVAAAPAPAAPAAATPAAPAAAAPVTTTAAPLSTAAAVAAAIDRRDWRAAARLCAPLINRDTEAELLATCGRAFCRARRGGDARRVIALVAQRDQETITRACLATGAFHEECDDPMACP